MNIPSHWGKWAFSCLGGLVVLYCLAVIAFVATAHDLGFRFLLIDSPRAMKSGPSGGIEIRRFLADSQTALSPRPAPGDRLVEVARQPVSSFLHFVHLLTELRHRTVPAGGVIHNSSIEELERAGDLLPPNVEMGGEPMVEIKYVPQGQLSPIRKYVPLQSVPWYDVLETLLWFLIVFAIFAVGAVAFWARPFDRQARVFFAMCAATLGGFVGGYHWWLIAGSLWLTIPFMIFAMLVPVTTLHFFLVYPEEKSAFARYPRRILAALYAVPVAWTVFLVGVVVYLSWIFEPGGDATEVNRWLAVLHEGSYAYFAVAALYFAATLVALAHSFLTTRNPILHIQVKWILWAAVAATIPVGYTLYLAHFHAADFALGAASLPMFTASLLFMLAYAVGIVRYKLMLLDQVLSRGMMYYIQSLGLRASFSVLIALSALAGMYQASQFSRQVPVMFVLVAAAVLLLNWSRDRLQQWIDRRYFREKFPIDKALSRMRQVPGGLADPAALSRRLLSSCRDLLQVDHAALYLREAGTGAFRVVASEGFEKAPPRLSPDEPLLSLLQAEPSLHRDGDETGDPPAQSQGQLLLRQLDVELIHSLEIDDQLAGLLMLGPKRTGARYTAEDLALLTSLGQVTCVALNGARIQQAVSRLNEELHHKLEKITEQQRLISMLQAEITARQQPMEAGTEVSPFRRELIKGASPAIRSVLETVRKVAGSQSSVLLRGESGTGKELLAQAIHENSPRRGGPMVSVHCGALSPGLLESELFGHVKGAFTGAHRDKIGRFEMADRGTLFLDEIGDISLDTQIKLLRVLQEREFEPVGGTRAVRVDVRLIAATHQNLERLISEGKFREDLFYRLNVISIALPPLRERQDDVIELALHFLVRSAERAGKAITHFDDAALDALRTYAWPGNIRELENAVERAVVMAEGPGITLHDLPLAILEPRQPRVRVLETKPAPRLILSADAELLATSEAALPRVASRQARRAAQKQQVVDAMQRAGGNKAEAARLLGLPRSTFFSRLKKHGLE